MRNWKPSKKADTEHFHLLKRNLVSTLNPLQDWSTADALDAKIRQMVLEVFVITFE